MDADMLAVYETSKSLIASDNVNSVLQTVVRGAMESLQPHRVTLIHVDLDSGEVLHFVSGGDDELDSLHIDFQELWEGLGGYAMRERCAVYSPDPYTEERETALVRERRLYSNSGPLVVAPMIYRDKVMGVLTVINLIGEPGFPESKRALVEVIANLAASALAMAALREKTQDAAKLKSQFMANISHEIRTPLNGIIGMTELMGQTKMSQKQRYFLRTIESSGEQLLSLVNDILDFADIDTGRIAISQHHMSLRQLSSHVVSEYQPAAHRKGLDLRCHVGADIPETVVGDDIRVRQILLHLVGNSVKFTPSGSVAIFIELDPTPHVEAGTVRVRFRIQDTGIGITDEQRSLIFETFSQGDGSMTREQGGVGMGLAITRRLVDMLGGRITVHSNDGTEFTVVLPFRLPWTTD